MSSEKAPTHNLQPGDQVLVSVPVPEENPREIWGFLVRVTGARPGDFWVIFDVLVSPLPHNSEYKINSVVKIHREQILQVVTKHKENPILHIRLAPEDNSILTVRRVDGNQEPVVIQVDEGKKSAVYRVDHRGWEEL